MQKQMKNNIHYSTDARHDLDEIWDYIASELQNISAAENTVNGIMDEVDQLVNFAEAGTHLSSVIDMESEYRFLVSGNYLIFYRVSGNDVYIDRILYGRRDYMKILFDNFFES